MKIIRNNEPLFNKDLNIKNDVLKLYCSIKHRFLEDLFIKISESETIDFYSWILQDKSVLSKISHAGIYYAFELLGNIRNTFSYGEKIQSATVVKYVHENSKYLDSIKYIISFKDINDKSVNDILNPYRDIIDAISVIFSITDSPDIASVLKDLYVIKNAYVSASFEESKTTIRKETVKQQKQKMFQYLFMRFTEDVAHAAESSGLSELANSVRSGALSKPVAVELANHLDFKSYKPGQLEIVKKLVEYIVKNYDYRMSSYNHDLIEVTLLSKAGLLTPEDVMKIKMSYEKNKDIGKIMSGDEDAKYPDLDLSSYVKVDQRLNPDYLLMLSSFFIIFQSKIGMPTGLAF